MRFYTTEQLGPRQSLTPEGFLLCEAVPIARTGEMVYGPDQVPVTPGKDGLVRIVRDETEVFKPQTIASFNGKPLCDDHPPVDVSPDNWCKLARGVVLNVRRGDGDEAAMLLSDILVTEASMIADVRAGKREVSCGYDAQYNEIEPGLGTQWGIIGNHVALVEKGRCGPRCAIGDRATETVNMTRTNDKRHGFLDRIRAAFKAKDEEKLEEALREAGDEEITSAESPGEQHIHVHVPGEPEQDEDPAPSWFKKHADSTEQRFRGIEDALGKLTKDEPSEREEMAERIRAKEQEGKKNKDEEAFEMEAPPGTGDKARRATDSIYLEDSFQETLAIAEILAPGISCPTFDRKETPKKTFDAICGLRRRALDLAYHQPSTRGIIDDVLAGKQLDLAGMTCDAVRTLFRSVGAAKKAINNKDESVKSQKTNARISSPAALNKRLAEIYK